MPKVTKVIISLVFIFLLYQFFPTRVSAYSINWNKSQIPDGISNSLHISQKDPNIVMATRSIGGLSNLMKSIDGGKNFLTSFTLPSSQDINSVILSNNNIDNAWLGTYGFGVYKTSDGGQNWIASGLSGKYIRTIEVDRSNDNNIYAGTGSDNGNGGLFKSTNGGTNWSQIGINEIQERNVLAIFVDRNNSNHIFADADPYLFFTTDGGQTWINSNLGHIGQETIVIDTQNSQKIYAVKDRYIFKSTDGGKNWEQKNNGVGVGLFHRLVQDPGTGYLYATRRGDGGGIWKSIDEGDNWENISDQTWGTASCWGMDALNGHIVVSVEGYGTFWADDNSTPTPSDLSHPIVVIPGFLGSWSYKGLVENQPTSTSDWIITPNFGEYYYNPLINTLKNAGLTEDQNLFTFTYDWRKSVADNAATLNDFLASKNSSQKFNIVAHSMGGLIIRYCYEKIPSCSDKINKVITAGSPHLGTLIAYPLWEGGLYNEPNPIMRVVYEIAIRAQAPYYLTTKDVIQNKMPGVRDLLPIFDYLNQKPYAQMSALGKNPILESLTPSSISFKSLLTSLSGNSIDTPSFFYSGSPTFAEKILGLWTDGRASYDYVWYTPGDSTILKTSAELSNPRSYSIEHKDYFRNYTILSNILTDLDLTGTPQTGTTPPSNFLAFIIHSPATMSVTDQNNNIVGTNLDGKAIFIPNPTSQKYNIVLTGTDTGPYVLDSYFSNGQNPTNQNTFQGQITLGQTQTIIFNNTNNSGSAFTNNNNDVYWQSFNAYSSQLTDQSTKNMIARYQATPVSKLELLYNSLLDILKKKQNPERQTIIFLIDSLAKHIESRGGLTTITKSLCDQLITRSQILISANENKSTITQTQALNIILAKEYLAKSQNYLSAGKYTSAYLSAKAATVLSTP